MWCQLDVITYPLSTDGRSEMSLLKRWKGIEGDLSPSHWVCDGSSQWRMNEVRWRGDILSVFLRINLRMDTELRWDVPDASNPMSLRPHALPETLCHWRQSSDLLSPHGPYHRLVLCYPISSPTARFLSPCVLPSTSQNYKAETGRIVRAAQLLRYPPLYRNRCALDTPPVPSFLIIPAGRTQLCVACVAAPSLHPHRPLWFRICRWFDPSRPAWLALSA